MTNLRIEQDNNIEVVTALILKKLYDIASSNSILTCVLKGNLLTQHCWEHVYNYLTGSVDGTRRFPELLINVTDGVYLDFADSVIADYWINSSYGDGEGITLASVPSVITWPKRETAINTSSEVFNSYNPETNTQLNNGMYAFFKDTSITSFNELGRFTNITTIPTSMFRESSLLYIDLSNITTIKAGAFYGADLTGVVNIPKLTTLGGRENSTKINVDNLYFERNENMTEVHIGEQVPDESKITRIPSYTFRNCTSLNNITGLSKITKIDVQAFRGCTSLENLEDLNTDSSIDISGSVFENCTSLKCIDLTNVTTIESNVFKDCSNLVALDTNDLNHINDNTEYTLLISNIGGNAFWGANLEGKTITFPYIFYIPQNLFRNSNINKVKAPQVTILNDNSFFSCKKLTEVQLGELQTINGGAFRECTALTTINADLSHVTSVGGGAFRDTPSLNIVVNLPNLTGKLQSTAFLNSGITKVLNLGTITRMESKAGYGEGAFKDCTNLTEVILPSTLIELGADAFNGCTLLTKITGTENIQTLGGTIFHGVQNITNCINFQNATDVYYYLIHGEGNGYCKVRLIYIPKLSQTKSATYTGARYRGTFVNIISDLIYFRDLQVIHPGDFAKCRCKALVINNVVPPIWKNGNDAETPASDGVSKSKCFWDHEIQAIYVPDSAVLTYKDDANWSTLSTLIHSMNDLTLVATEADLLENQVALIQAYMNPQ